MIHMCHLEVVADTANRDPIENARFCVAMALPIGNVQRIFTTMVLLQYMIRVAVLPVSPGGDLIYSTGLVIYRRSKIHVLSSTADKACMVLSMLLH